MKAFKLKYELEREISLDEIKALLPTDLSWEKNVRSYNFLPNFQLELLVENFRGEPTLQKINLHLRDLKEAVTYEIETQIMPSFTLETTARQLKIYWCLSEAEIPLKNILDWFEFFGWEIPKGVPFSHMLDCGYDYGCFNNHQIEFFHKLLGWQTDFTIPVDKLPMHISPDDKDFEKRVREAIGIPSRKIDTFFLLD